jgi:hypothetical protein
MIPGICSADYLQTRDHEQTAQDCHVPIFNHIWFGALLCLFSEMEYLKDAVVLKARTCIASKYMVSR